MAAIHQSLGICPQYNTLFDWLTVYEHLLFCGYVRGVPHDKLLKDIPSLLTDLNLMVCMHVLICMLSLKSTEQSHVKHKTA